MVGIRERAGRHAAPVDTTAATPTAATRTARLVTVVATLVAVLAGAAVVGSAPALAISGGGPADDTGSAFAVRLDIVRSATTSWTCSGSLVAPDLVLTAAHCLYSHRPGDWTLTFAGGAAPVEKRGVRAVLPYSVDAGAGPVNSVDDLGLVQLDAPVTDRSPVRLDQTGTLDRLAASHGPVVEIGYGGTGTTANPKAVRAGQVVVSTTETLPVAGMQSVVPLVETGVAPGTVPAGSCQAGDSGGPLISGDGAAASAAAGTSTSDVATGTGSVLLGVTSRGNAGGNCWFTRVDSASPYRAWLDDKIARFGGAPSTTTSSTTTSATPTTTSVASPVVAPTPTATVVPAVPAAPTVPVTPVAVSVTPASPAIPVVRAGRVAPASPAPDAALLHGLGDLAGSAAAQLAAGEPVARGGARSTGGPVPILAPVSPTGATPW